MKKVMKLLTPFKEFEGESHESISNRKGLNVLYSILSIIGLIVAIMFIVDSILFDQAHSYVFNKHSQQTIDFIGVYVLVTIIYGFWRRMYLKHKDELIEIHQRIVTEKQNWDNYYNEQKNRA